MPALPGERAARSGAVGWATRFADLLLPPACAGCGVALSATQRRRGRVPGVCPGCLARLRAPSHPRCSRCQAPRGTGLPADRECDECRLWPAALASARSAALLVPPADALVQALKYGGWRCLATDLAERMIRTLDDPAGVRARMSPGVRAGVSAGAAGALTAGAAKDARGRVGRGPRVVPVPTTPGRLRRRGYNQARLLAAELSVAVGGVLVDALLRREGGRTQVGLHRDERWANVERAFSVDASAADTCIGEDVILVDDVLTTGATASAAASVLVEAGARSVSLSTFARSLPPFE